MNERLFDNGTAILYNADLLIRHLSIVFMSKSIESGRSSFDVARSLLEAEEQGVEVVLVCTPSGFKGYLKERSVVLKNTGHFGENPHIQFEDPAVKAVGSGYVDWVAAERVEEIHPLKQED